MSLIELRSLSAEKLSEEYTKLQRMLFALKMQRGMGESIKPHLFKQYKKDIARINTIINEKNND